ncbi:C10 family peptidase [Candidatus Eisenbacteria bacterium]|uniref:C10 family peptidase n=1 Tax=Eiseniibacteriota bacterium TaxID=2212470 RepID=A0ABV6YNE5_UNCEI
MNKYRYPVLAALLLCLCAAHAAFADPVTRAEAEKVASNWISAVLHSQGKWGDHQEAHLGEIEELWHGGRLLGYCCHVEPGGYIIVPIHKAMAPVKAFMTRGKIDPMVDIGAVALTKDVLGCMVDFVETEYGPLGEVTAEDLRNVLEVDYSDNWRRFNVAPEVFREDLKTSGPAAQPLSAMGDILTTSVWSQCALPYNLYCPLEASCSSGRCCSGCTSIAGAQIMHYWNWPPYGQYSDFDDPYNWSLMPDSTSMSGPPSASDSALAELCYEAGIACSTDFCSDDCASSAFLVKMMSAFENNFRYQPNMYRIWRGSYDADQWWPFVTGEIDAGHPAEYKMTDHAMVLDGYWEESGNRFYHFNMGWGGTGSPSDPCWDPYPYTNTWYAMNSIPCNEPDHVDEWMLGNIRPVNLTSFPFSGTYPKPAFPYRYFEEDLGSSGAVFESGQYLQFHREAFFVCAHPGPIVFNGSPTAGSTHIYNNGDPTRGIRIDNGAITFNYGGQMRLHWNN